MKDDHFFSRFVTLRASSTGILCVNRSKVARRPNSRLRALPRPKAIFPVSEKIVSTSSRANTIKSLTKRKKNSEKLNIAV